MKPSPAKTVLPKARNTVEIDEAERTRKLFQLRLLMKEREVAAEKLVKLDFNIWVLEEFFRAGA